MGVINMPQQQKSNTGSLMTLAGMGAGAALGCPVGAGIGGQVGGMVGGMSSQQAPPPQAIESNALSRRQAQMDATPVLQIQDSLKALQEIPDPQQRMELAKPLLQADYMARNGKAGQSVG